MYTIGILGGGQLARMSIMAAKKLGISAISLDEDPDSPAAQVGAAITGSITEPSDIARVMAQCKFITFENEFIPADAIRQACLMADFEPEKVTPRIETLEMIQDKLTQRRTLINAGVPSPKAMPALEAALLGFPCVLKSRFGGYDGKGTRYARSKEEYISILEEVNADDWLAEEFVEFRRELSVMVCAKEGRIDCYPAMVTEQSKHVCDVVYDMEESSAKALAIDVAKQAILAVSGTGLFGVELFEHLDGSISVNEIAPRPHNSGHYTLDWGGSSQFESHILLACGRFEDLHFGKSTCMVNLLGRENTNSLDQAKAELASSWPQAHLHWYGKKDVKPGRKMGHINLTHGESGETTQLVKDAREARAAFYRGWKAT